MITITRILDAGVANQERILFEVTGTDDTGRYEAFLTTELQEGRIRAKPSDVYWFPDKEVRSGDLVILYTKPGEYSVINNQLGTRTHFFYWGSKGTLLNKPKDAIALLTINGWSYKALP